MPKRLIRRLPQGVRTYPMDASFVVLGIPTSLVSLFGLSSSTALGTLPGWTEALWAIVLLVGSVAWLVGILSTRLDTDTGSIVIERVPTLVLGLSLFCVAAFVYSIAVIATAGYSGIIASLYPLSVALGTYIRRTDLAGRMKDAS